MRPSRQRLPLRYFLAALVALFVLPILIWLIWGWVEAARLDRALDALEARHEPLDIADFDRKPATAEQREASHLYAQAGRAVDDRPITMEQATALSKSIETACSPDTAASVRSEQIRLLLEFEERYRPVFDLLERASQLEARGWDDGDRPQRQSMEEMRPITLARANVVRIARLACTGDGVGAARALLASLRLRRVWVGALIRPIALQTAHGLESLLTLSRPTSDLLEQIQDEYIAGADEARFQDWIVRERAVWLSSAMPGVFSAASAGSGPRRMTPAEAVARRLVRPLRDHRLVEELNEFTEAIAIASQPWPAKLETIADFGRTRQRRHSQSMRPGLLDELTRPLGADVASHALSGYIAGMTETLARNRASAMASAVARYRLDHAGACPQTLRQLVPPHATTVLIDPYSGVEMKYRCDQAGYCVYSVGADRKDDGGTWEQHSDLQLSRRGNPPDIGIAVTRSTARQPD